MSSTIRKIIMNAVFDATAETATSTDAARSYRLFADTATSRLSAAEVESLIAARGTPGWQAARTALVKGMSRYVVGLAYKFSRTSNIAQDDLVQEGQIGVLGAAESFDPSLGHRFMTYAAAAARNAMLGLVVPRKNDPSDNGIDIDSDHTFLELPDGAPTPDEVFQTKRDAVTVRAALARMSAVNRNILLQRFGFVGEDVSMQDIADSLGLGSLRNAHYRLGKALKEFDRCMKRNCRG